jgi:hypothetical protein
MVELPQTLEQAIEQAQAAAKAAIADGLTRLQIELLIPELRTMPLAQQFIAGFEEWGEDLRVFFSDPGAAALARRDWGEKPYAIRGIGELKAVIQPNEQVFVFIEPSSVEVDKVEQLCEHAADRPVILFLPRMEDVATIGIGYAGRQLRERFLNQIEPCYYLRPMEGAAVFRCYPSVWQVLLETEGGYEIMAEQATKPVGEALERLLMQANGLDQRQETPSIPNPGLFKGLKQFLKALNQ